MSLTSNTTPLKWIAPKSQATMKSRNATQNRSAIKVKTTNVDLYKTPGIFQFHEYCLLYEYLHRNPYKQAFSNFRDTIGSDVFTEEQLLSFFNQFRTRKIKGYTRSITNLRDVLCDDKIALRACIIYETLRCKMVTRGYSTSYLWPRSTLKRHEILRNPSFPLYKNFCEKLGNDAMEYREFDYWFYRFLNGDFNLSCEKEKDEKNYELTDMPMDIMKRIVGNLDIFDRISLAQTSRSFKTFVKDQKVFHQKIGLYIDDRSACISFNNRYMGICEESNGCCRRSDRPEKHELIQDVPYWKQGIWILETIFNCSELYLDVFRLHLFGQFFFVCEGFVRYEKVNGDRFNFYDEVFDALGVALKPIGQVYAEQFIFGAHSMKPLLKILPFLKPGYLSTIDLDVPEDSCHFEELESLEQWKQAKSFNMTHGFYVAPLYHLYHFQKFKILFTSPNFERCTIQTLRPVDMGAFRMEFEDSTRRSWNTYHYSIPDSTDYFEVQLRERKIKIKRHATAI
ncbi:unnamed protein product [Caenorhabditis brenneri]